MAGSASSPDYGLPPPAQLSALLLTSPAQPSFWADGVYHPSYLRTSTSELPPPGHPWCGYHHPKKAFLSPPGWAGPSTGLLMPLCFPHFVS